MLSDLIQEPFLGFPEEALEFLKKLENKRNNNKKWFDKHKDEYEAYLKQPMRTLVDALVPELAKVDKQFLMNYKSIYRINRDIRFSKDKTPYKDYYAAAFCFDRIKAAEIPHVYFEIESDKLIIAAGQYSMDPVNLKKVRYKIFSEFDEFLSIIEDKKFKKMYGEVTGVKQVRLSGGFEEVTDKKMAEYLKMKQFYVWKSYKPELALDSSFVDLIIEHAKISHDFVKFLWEAIK